MQETTQTDYDEWARTHPPEQVYCGNRVRGQPDDVVVYAANSIPGHWWCADFNRGRYVYVPMDRFRTRLEAQRRAAELFIAYRLASTP